MFCKLKQQILPILFGILVSEIFLSIAAASTFTLIDTIPVIDQSVPESLAPRDLVVTPDGSRLYIYNIVPSGSIADVRVLVVDVNLKQLVNIISLGAGATSNGITVTSDGFVYLPISRCLSSLAIGESRVEVIDTATDTPVASILPFTGAGSCGPDGPAITPDGGRIYFTYRGSQRIYEIGTSSNTILDIIATSTTELIDIDITPDGTRGYAVNRQDRKIYVFNTDPLSPSFNTLITAVPTSLSSSVSRAAIKITPDGTRAYVTIAYTNPSSVSVIDIDPTSPSFHTEIAVIPTTGSTLKDIAITSDGRTALIASVDTNEVIVIDIDPTSPTFHTQIGSVPLPSGAFDITYDPVSDRAFVSLLGDNSIGVIAPVTALSLSCSGFDSPMNFPVTVRKHRALPHKAYLSDVDGNIITNADLASPPVIQVLFDSGLGGNAVDVTDQALPAGQGTDGNEFTFNNDGKWQFNLKTKNYTASGAYTISMISGDSDEYIVDPTCEATFAIED